MLKLDGYKILTPIYESANSIVYRAIRQQDNQPVILKRLKQDYPTPTEITRYRQEYEILRQFNLEGVIKAYSLQEVQRTPVIILEDFGGNSLKMLRESSVGEHGGATLPLPEFFHIAIKTAESLGQIHNHNIIHKDINPANIVLNPETGQVKIIDFGISTQLSRQNPILKNPNVLEGTLAYISPEQTGRMNRSLDYRTDFYSLGVTFYELLTGQLPFETDDLLELVHCHLAKRPASLDQVNTKIPQPVSALVMKLMKKTAEERYQSAWGLKADLEKCLRQLETVGQIKLFSLGTQDISNKFQIPQKLYGREKEVATLLESFKRVSQGAKELILVAGYSGIGKSVLVQEVNKPITKARGYFISGKFNQFQRNIPYSAVVSAFASLVRQLLSESEEQLNLWREKLLTALGVNAQVIIDVIPEVELIIGPQPAVPELGATEIQNRFNLVFQNFIRVFCSESHPLVIFLDDLQWADSATLKLMELMMTDADTQYLFLIGAYRDNEVSPTHPLIITLEELGKVGAIINQITLTTLNLNCVSEIIADTLHSNLAEVKSLAELVMHKTNGNPFFVNEFLKTLYGDKLLNFDFASRTWRWDISQIEAMNITDNVVELMISKLKKLPLNTQHILRLAACVGAEFDLNTLAIICEKPATEVFNDLKEAIHSGLILSISDLDEQLLIQDYQFGHDRIQQAAYALIDQAEKKVVHLQIGRLLLQNVESEILSENLFAIIDHLNLGQELISEPAEREQLAQLNLSAGRKATSATAYSAAVQYLHIGIELLVEDSWETQYDLTLELYSRTAEAAYLNSNIEQMERLADVVLQSAKTILDKLKVYEIKILSYILQHKLLEAINTALLVLEFLGVNFSQSPTLADIQQGLEETLSILTDRPIEDLINLPQMTDPYKLAAMAIASSIFSATYITAPTLLPLIVFKQVNLSLQYGNTPLSAVTYAYFGLLLCGMVGDIELGYQFGQLSLKLVDQFHAKELLAKVLVVFHGCIGIWKEPLNASLQPVQIAHQIGLDTGDFEYAAICYYITAFHSFFIGKNLEELDYKITSYIDFLVKLKATTYINYTKIYHQAFLKLLKSSENPCKLIGKVYNEEVMLPLHIAANDRYAVCAVSVNKLHLCYQFQEYEQALENAVRAEEYLDGATATLVILIFYFYDSLTRLALYPSVVRDEQSQILDKVAANQEKMQKWASHAPMNYLHKYYLVEAEKYRVTGAKYEAIANYNRAIDLAKEQGFINDEALANELVAKYYLELGKYQLAQVHIQEAHYCYSYWGAMAKVKDLEARYPKLLIQSPAKNQITNIQKITTIPSTQTKIGESLDLATVIKASQAIGSEIVFEQLLRKLMTILLENAGAQRGFLLLETNEQLLIEAEGSVDSDELTVLQSIPIENRLPTSLINYVVRTSESVVLNNATVEGNFTNDPYVLEHQPKSILCVPLINQGKLISLVYLENNLTTGAFTPDRLEVLKILSSQAAISIENARLYQTLEDKVKERTSQLQAANQEISTLNERLKQENLRMSAELEITKQLQQMVLPKQSELDAIEGLEIAGFMEPADEVGGDYYDVLQQDGRVKIGIGDVTGHGLESGVLMLMTQTAVRTLQESNQTDPVQFLDILNRTIYGNVQRINPYKNLTLSLLDYADGVLTLSGQHESIIVVRSGGIVELIDTKYLGFPIGLESDIADFIATEQVQLNPGDVVVLYTDGITEAFNINQEEYGLLRLCEVVSRNWESSAQGIKEAVIEDLRLHIGEQKVFDDITLVVLKQK